MQQTLGDQAIARFSVLRLRFETPRRSLRAQTLGRSGYRSQRYSPKLTERAVLIVAERHSEHESDRASMVRVPEGLGDRAQGSALTASYWT